MKCFGLGIGKIYLNPSPPPQFGCEKSAKERFLNIFASFYPILTLIPYLIQDYFELFFCKIFWNLVCLFPGEVANFKLQMVSKWFFEKIDTIFFKGKQINWISNFFLNQNVHKNSEKSRVQALKTDKNSLL